MNLEELKELCAKITYKGKPCVAVKDYNFRAPRITDSGLKLPGMVPDGYVYISTWIHAICVKEGTPTQIENGILWSIKEVEEITKGAFVKNIKEALISLETHEVEELMAVDGVHIFDPHGDLELPKVNLNEEKEAA